MSKDNVTNGKCKIIPTSYFSFRIFAPLNCCNSTQGWQKTDTSQCQNNEKVKRNSSYPYMQTLYWKFNVTMKWAQVVTAAVYWQEGQYIHCDLRSFNGDSRWRSSKVTVGDDTVGGHVINQKLDQWLLGGPWTRLCEG